MVNVDTLMSPNLQKLWNDWELRIIMLLSMSLQILLASFAPCRKITKRVWIISLISIAHSLGEWIAAYGVGLISSSQESNNSSDAAVATPFLSLWASFFFYHIGGVDSITSPSLDDDYLWLKQLVRLVAHVLAIVSIYFKSFPNKLPVPTILVFVGGIVRNTQRVISLLRRSSEILKDSRGTAIPVSQAEKLRETYTAMKEANMPIQIPSQPLPPKSKISSFNRKMSSFIRKRMLGVSGKTSSMLDCAYLLYNMFKCFITKATFSSQDRLSSREFFRNKTPKEAFQLLELELDYLYEALYTQLNTSSRDLITNSLGPLNLYLLVPSLVIFGKVEKQGWHKFDIVLTYVLLSAALLQELISIYWSRDFLAGTTFFWLSRWSRSVCHINLIDWCLGHHSILAKLVDKVAAPFCDRDVREILKLNLSVSIRRVTKTVKKIIFDELKMKSAFAENKETAMKICSQRGGWALMRSSLYKELKWSLGDLDYGKSLILWHIATELCYVDSESKRIGDEMKEKREFRKTVSDYCESLQWLLERGNDDEKIEGDDDDDEKIEGDDDDDEMQNRRTFCKILSDYILYLLVLKPNMMVSVAGDWKTVFDDTCEQARSFLLTRSVADRSEACEQIRSTYINMPETRPRSKSVLVRACVLAKQLQSLQGNDPWKVMSQVWVELLAFAAFHCEPDIHAQQPGQGGELLTFVWLLINHLGFGKQIMEEDASTEEYT